jgi:hypothetical protein
MDKTMNGDKHSSPRQRILSGVVSWPGITCARGRFGSRAMKLGARELGHVHSKRVADSPLPGPACDRLVEQRVVLPQSSSSVPQV